MFIRANGNDEIRVCDHIAVVGELFDAKNDHCEYSVYVDLKCNVCGEKYSIEVAVN